MAENLGLSEAVARAGAATGLKPRIIKLPDWFIAAALPLTRLLERFVRFPPALSSESLNGQWSTFSQTLSGDKARRELGFEPAPLDAVLREVVTAELDAKRSRQPKH